MSRVTMVFATGALAMLVGCNQYETLAGQRMREICRSDPNICENGLIVAKYLGSVSAPAAIGDATATQIKNRPIRKLTAVLEQEWAMSICRH